MYIKYIQIYIFDLEAGKILALHMVELGWSPRYSI